MTLNPADAAAATGVPETTIKRWARTGRITNYGTWNLVQVNHDEVARAERATFSDQLATVDEIATLFGRTPGSIYKLACTQKWRRIRNGSRTYYDLGQATDALGQSRARPYQVMRRA
jgi:hypothetical protein